MINVLFSAGDERWPAYSEALPFAFADKGLEVPGVLPRMPVNSGGPADTTRAFVLHPPDYRAEARTMSISSDISMTPDPHVLEDMIRGAGPSRRR